MGINEQFKNDLKKGVMSEPVMQELPTGGGRRYEPEVGVKKHNERIHRESRRADHYGNLPFSFSKPSKPKGRSTYLKCNNCGHVISATTTTVGVICNECGKFSSVSEVEYDG